MKRGAEPARLRRRWRTAAALVLLCAGSAPALAQGRGAELLKKAAKDQSGSQATKASVKSRNGGVNSTTPGKPLLVNSYGDWGVYTSIAPKSKVCYALAQPKDRSPASLKRESAYIFISNRPGEGVRNEVSIIMGLPLKDGANGGKAEIGSTSFELVAKGQNAFVKNAAEEGQFVDTLKRRGSRLVIKLPTAKGPLTTDTYSLAGLSQALDRVGKECP